MPRIWDTPLYHLTTKTGNEIIIDVTLSVNPALGPNQAIAEVIAFFKRKKVKTVIDFGAGSLRHTIPLLKAGFRVCAVDFEEQYLDCDSKRVCHSNRQMVERNPNFSALVYPRDFTTDDRIFDAALLCYTLQGMPIANERKNVLLLLHKKLSEHSYLAWMSRFGDSKSLPVIQEVEDGHYKYPSSRHHSFYREYSTDVIHQMMSKIGWRRHFHHVKSLGQVGGISYLSMPKRKRTNGCNR